MKKIILIITVASLFSCITESNTEKKNTGLIIQGNSPLQIMTLDSCEYLYGAWGNATVLTHKGNCKYCKVR